MQAGFFKFCGVPFCVPNAVVERVEMIAALNRIAASPTADRTSRQFVEGWMQNPKMMQPLIESYRKNAEALRNLRKATLAGKVTAEIRAEGDRCLIEAFLPDKTPSGVFVGRDTKIRFLESAKLKDFPSLSIESAIAEHSWSATDEPTPNLMVDKFHLISALPYVDHLVSNDKYFHSILPIAASTGFVRAKVLKFDEFAATYL